MNDRHRQSLHWVCCGLWFYLSGCASQGLREVQLPPPPRLDPQQVAVAKAAPREIFVDPRLQVDRCQDYDIASRRCGAGVQLALRDLNRAAAEAKPGDRVLVREGVIRKQFAPAVSGVEGHPVSFMPYRGETVVFRDIDRPAWLL
jgi:hypothetical protein